MPRESKNGQDEFGFWEFIGKGCVDTWWPRNRHKILTEWQKFNFHQPKNSAKPAHVPIIDESTRLTASGVVQYSEPTTPNVTASTSAESWKSFNIPTARTGQVSRKNGDVSVGGINDSKLFCGISHFNYPNSHSLARIAPKPTTSTPTTFSRRALAPSPSFLLNGHQTIVNYK